MRRFNLMVMVLLTTLLMSSSAAWSLDRFVDLNDGTVLDTVSSLRWLKNADCYGQQDWAAAMSSAAGLSSPSCGLTDGSTAGDWHLPTIDELRIFTDAGYRYDTLNTAGFSNVQPSFYWSSSSYANLADYAWVVYMNYGDVGNLNKPSNGYVWPVRSGQYWSLGSLVIFGAGDFGSVPVGSVSPGHQFTLKNLSTSLPITSLALTGTDPTQFTLVTGGGVPCSSLTPTLAAGESCTVVVSAKATSLGSKSANLTVTSGGLSVNAPLSATTHLAVTYDGNGSNSGSLPTDSIKYPLNATVTVLGNSGTLAKTGYVFNGWNTSADASGTTYQPGATFTIITPVTLYPDLTLRHIGFLGGMPPAVKGLADIAFADGNQQPMVIEFNDWKMVGVGRLLSNIRDYLVETLGVTKADNILPSWQLQDLQALHIWRKRESDAI